MCAFVIAMVGLTTKRRVVYLFGFIQSVPVYFTVPNIESLFIFFLEYLRCQVSPGVKRHNLGWVTPGWMRTHLESRLCQVEIRTVVTRQITNGYGQCAIYTVGSTIGTNSISFLNLHMHTPFNIYQR